MSITSLQAPGGKSSRIWSRFMLALIPTAGLYWLWAGLTQRSIRVDDGITILAAKGILEHGYPLLPSGGIYHRAYLSSYLDAASIGVFGLNEFGIILPSLLAALGVLALVYVYGKDVLKNPAGGVIAAIGLVLLQEQTIYATSPRMYMLAQFTAVAVCYFAWRGYVQDDVRFRWFTVLAISAAVLSHRQAGVLLVAVPAAVIAVRWLSGRKFGDLVKPGLLLAWLVPWLLFVFVGFYEPPSTAELGRIADRGGVDPQFIEFELSLERLVGHLRRWEELVPFGLALLPGTVWLTLLSLRKPLDGRAQGMVYTVTAFGLCAAANIALLQLPVWRYWMWLLATYVLLLAHTIVVLGGWLRSQHFRQVTRKTWRRLMAVVVACWFTVFFAATKLDPVDWQRMTHETLLLPPHESGDSELLKELYHGLRSDIAEGDVLVSSLPWLTDYYLGHVDGFLRQRILPDGSLTTFESATDEYYGIPLIDREEELRALLRSPARVWVLKHYDVTTTDDRLHRVLEEEFAIHTRHNYLTVYVSPSN